MQTKRRIYDHRIKLAIIRTGKIDLFPDLNIPKTTAKNWINRPRNEVVTLDIFDLNREQLEQRCLALEKQVSSLEVSLITPNDVVSAVL